MDHGDQNTLNETPDMDGALPTCASGEGPSVDSIVNLMPGFVYVFSHLTYSNEYTNRSVARHLGYSSAQIAAFGSQMLLRIVHPDDQHILPAHMARIAKLADGQNATVDYRVIAQDGAERWLRSVDTVFERSAQGDVIRHIGCATDITTEKQAQLKVTKLNADLEGKVIARTADLANLNAELEERIARRTQELEDAVVELEQLTFIATHDLKVPANNLSRLALMLKEQPDICAPERGELVDWINQSAEQLHSKIHGMVLVAQIRLSSALPIKTLNLRSEILRTIEGLEQETVHMALPATVNVDPAIQVDFARFELGSIVTSILDNAVKYADPDRALCITLDAIERDGSVVLTIADNGTGVDSTREADKVFGLFQRAHKTPAGSGISLYCAKRMLEHRGGGISVSGTRGQGASFEIKFPKQGDAQ